MSSRHHIISVSYTHLDVYKRQALFCACAVNEIKAMKNAVTICFIVTNASCESVLPGRKFWIDELDVYKRQVLVGFDRIKAGKYL